MPPVGTPGDPPEGLLLAETDRLLFKDLVSTDGIAVDVTIERDVECTGLIIVAAPLAGSTVGTELVLSQC